MGQTSGLEGLGDGITGKQRTAPVHVTVDTRQYRTHQQHHQEEGYLLLHCFWWQMEDLQGWKDEGVGTACVRPQMREGDRVQTGGKYLPPAAGALQEGIPPATISRLREQRAAGSC